MHGLLFIDQRIDDDRFDFHFGPFGQSRHLDRGTGRVRMAKVRRVDLIQGRKVIQIGQENRRLDDVAHFQIHFSQGRFHVFEHLVSLFLDVSRHQIAVGIQGQLTAEVHEITEFNGG